MIQRELDFPAVVWFVSLSSCLSPNELTDGRGEGEEPNHTTVRKSYIINHPIFSGMVSQRDVVYLGWPIAPSYMSPNAGGGGLQGLNQWVQLCTWSPNKEIGDRTPYLSMLSGNSDTRFWGTEYHQRINHNKSGCSAAFIVKYIHKSMYMFIYGRDIKYITLRQTCTFFLCLLQCHQVLFI
jgi:hypothetical protein